MGTRMHADIHGNLDQTHNIKLNLLGSGQGPLDPTRVSHKRNPNSLQRPITCTLQFQLNNNKNYNEVMLTKCYFSSYSWVSSVTCTMEKNEIKDAHGCIFLQKISVKT
jgi:hypothetical protein